MFGMVWAKTGEAEQTPRPSVMTADKRLKVRMNGIPFLIESTQISLGRHNLAGESGDIATKAMLFKAARLRWPPSKPAWGINRNNPGLILRAKEETKRGAKAPLPKSTPSGRTKIGSFLFTHTAAQIAL